ncbi:MAG: VacJ family lipoprotein [Deltaproteobacteria bacterium]|nr:VacJ family lipoprotein [Deltaproteobacteria bacterium]
MKRILTGLVFLLAIIVGSGTSAFSGSSVAKDAASSLPDENGRRSYHTKEVMTVAQNIEDTQSVSEEETAFEQDFGTTETIPDPFETYNRPFYSFNDRLYFYVLKPTAQGYASILPERARISIKKFFYNLYFPVRFVNCALQGKSTGAFTELSRFTINTTLGIAGFFDPATSLFKLEMEDEDFSQTLGCFMGPGFYINAPFSGPTSVRDSVGAVVDLLIVPTWYVLQNYSYIYTGVKVFQAINNTSLAIGEYEDLKRSALDPYISLRNAYFQHREDLIKR